MRGLIDKSGSRVHEPHSRTRPCDSRRATAARTEPPLPLSLTQGRIKAQRGPSPTNSPLSQSRNQRRGDSSGRVEISTYQPSTRVAAESIFPRRFAGLLFLDRAGKSAFLHYLSPIASARNACGKGSLVAKGLYRARARARLPRKEEARQGGGRKEARRRWERSRGMVCGVVSRPAALYTRVCGAHG